MTAPESDPDIETSTETEPTERRSRRLPTVTAVLLSAFAVVLALIGADVALISGAQKPAPRIINVVHLAASNSSIAPVVYMTVSPDMKPGADGKLHDAYSVSDFYVRAGHPIKLVIHNTDNVPHSITSPAAGVNITIRPGTHTYTLVVDKTGRFQWHCRYPCDPYSMAHDGYMMGYITSI
ncbi:MAG: cupredoxin domain-containing protein [Solirubrobacteraceae bacterium]